jgi:hypothetical protein
MFRDSFDVRNRVRGSGREIGSKQDIVETHGDGGGSGFHGLCPPERIFVGTPHGRL